MRRACRAPSSEVAKDIDVDTRGALGIEIADPEVVDRRPVDPGTRAGHADRRHLGAFEGMGEASSMPGDALKLFQSSPR